MDKTRHGGYQGGVVTETAPKAVMDAVRRLRRHGSRPPAEASTSNVLA